VISGNCRKHSEKLATCWSQPSRMQGTQAPIPWTSMTLPMDWLPTRCHGEVAPVKSFGQGPHLTGLEGPYNAPVGTPIAAAICVVTVSGPPETAATAVREALW